MLIDDIGFGPSCAFRKYRETPPWDVSVSGPYDRWPKQVASHWLDIDDECGENATSSGTMC